MTPEPDLEKNTGPEYRMESALSGADKAVNARVTQQEIRTHVDTNLTKSRFRELRDARLPQRPKPRQTSVCSHTQNQRWWPTGCFNRVIVQREGPVTVLDGAVFRRDGSLSEKVEQETKHHILEK